MGIVPVTVFKFRRNFRPLLVAYRSAGDVGEAINVHMESDVADAPGATSTASATVPIIAASSDLGQLIATQQRTNELLERLITMGGSISGSGPQAGCIN